MTATPTVNGHKPVGETMDRALARNSEIDEKAVLGAMMSCAPKSAVPGEIREMLWPGDEQSGVGEHHFANWTHKLIWKTIIGLMDAGEPHDVNGVLAALPEDKRHLLLYLLECFNACLTEVNGTYYARNVARATLLRELAEAEAQSFREASGAALNDAEDVYERARRRLDQLAVPTRAGAMVVWEKAANEAFEEMERLDTLAKMPEDAEAGVFSTGWPDLDRLLGPVAPGSLIIVAARPGVGKSVAGRGIAQHLAMRKRLPVPLFSLEMSRLEIAVSMMAAGARLRLYDIKNGALSDDDWVEAARYLGQTADAPLEIDDTAGMTLAGIDRALGAVRRKYGQPPAAFVLDYLQLLDERGNNRQEAVSAMSRRLKRMCKEHNTVGVVLSQLNRESANRTDKRPQLSDLRESGSIEQDADVVILLHREDYYDKESPRAGEADFIVAKHRGGSTDTITLAAQLHMSRFVSMALPA